MYNSDQGKPERRLLPLCLESANPHAFHRRECQDWGTSVIRFDTNKLNALDLLRSCLLNDGRFQAFLLSRACREKFLSPCYTHCDTTALDPQGPSRQGVAQQQIKEQWWKGTWSECCSIPLRPRDTVLRSWGGLWTWRYSECGEEKCSPLKVSVPEVKVGVVNSTVTL